MFVDSHTFALLLPELVLVVMATLLFIGGTLIRSPGLWSRVATASILLSALAMLQQPSVDVVGYFSGPLAVDYFATSLRWLSLLVGLLLVMAAGQTGPKALHTEMLGSLLLVTAGMMLVSTAGDLVLMFMGLELISIPTYVLLFLGRRNRAAAEATTKYFFLSILSSALFLYGLSFLYGVSGSTFLPDIAAALSPGFENLGGGAFNRFLPLALVLIVAGLGFRIAAVPFHFYAPDVYQGTTNTMAGLLAVVPKIVGVAALVRIVVIAMPGLEQFGWQLALTLSVLTMTIGNVSALWQKNLRRMLAYSSIAHAGYLLLGLSVALGSVSLGASATKVAIYDGLTATLFYLSVYSLATLGTFTALAYLSSREQEISQLSQLSGLSESQPAVSAAIAVFMFSLAGIPPLAGFWGKLGLFSSTLALAGETAGTTTSNWFIALAVIGVLNAAISAAYYLRVISALYFQPAASDPVQARGGGGALFATLICSALVVAIGVVPQRVISYAQQASDSARASVIARERPNTGPAEIDTAETETVGAEGAETEVADATRQR